jgi:hypothetical protein
VAALERLTLLGPPISGLIPPLRPSRILIKSGKAAAKSYVGVGEHNAGRNPAIG